MKRAWLITLGLVLGCGGGDQTPVQAPPPMSKCNVHAAAWLVDASVPSAPGWSTAAYRAVIDEAIDAMLASDPVRATWAGDHRFDAEWPDLTPEAEARIAMDFGARAGRLRSLADVVPEEVLADQVTDAGTDRPALDARVLADRLDAQAFRRAELRRAEHDPSLGPETLGAGITTITAHDYAPLPKRMAALAARLEKAPAMLEVVRGRLVTCSRAGFENMGVVAGGVAKVLRGEIAAIDTARLGGDATLAKRLHDAALGAAAALDAYTADVRKRFEHALDDTPLGADKWATLARLWEGVAEPPADVRKVGERELARLEAELDELIGAGQSPPRKGPRTPKERTAFFRKLEADAPPPDKVLDEYRKVNHGVEQWLHEHAFVTVPWDKVQLAIVQTPPEHRGTSFASMNPAGPLEPAISDAHFEVNIPEASMPDAQRKALSAFHARGAIDLVSIHEALPGHYLQFLWQKRSPSKVRKLVWASTLGEGWAHYCEQAVVEAGYVGDDATRTRAFFLRMGLQRAVRVIIDVGENDGSMTLDQGQGMLEEHAFLAPAAARMEARRGMVSPANMFAYTYGKVTIQRLRDAVKAKEGSSFDLVHFHDRLLAIGALPVRYMGKVAFGVE
jgi:uncharacterized protein (DUF885 family)